VVLGLITAVLATATRGIAPRTMEAPRQTVNADLILQETRLARERSSGLVVRLLDTVVLRMITV
jgi:hypothetical protein